MLRAAGRVFLGLGPTPGVEERAPTDDEREKADRPFWLMMVPAALLLALSLPGADAAARWALRAAAQMMHPDAGAIIGLPVPTPQAVPLDPGVPGRSAVSWISVALALAITAFQLGRGTLPRGVAGLWSAAAAPVASWLQELHSGLVGDYVVWAMAGLGLFACAFAFL